MFSSPGTGQLKDRNASISWYTGVCCKNYKDIHVKFKCFNLFLNPKLYHPIFFDFFYCFLVQKWKIIYQNVSPKEVILGQFPTVYIHIWAIKNCLHIISKLKSNLLPGKNPNMKR